MKILFTLFGFFTIAISADIIGLVQMLDRNDTVKFKSMIVTVEDANAARSDNNKTVLMYASWLGNLEAVHHLVAQGANINATDSSGATALHLAIWKDNTEIALFLLENGASAVLVSNEGMSPTDMAVYRSNTKVLEAIEKGKPKLKSLF